MLEFLLDRKHCIAFLVIGWLVRGMVYHFFPLFNSILLWLTAIWIGIILISGIVKKESRIDAIDAEQRTNNALEFCQKIEENGRTPMIYTNLSWSESYYDLYRIMNYPLWFAQYNNLPGLDYEFVVWQYSDHAEIDGIEELVDTNLYFNFHKQQED